MNYQSWISWKFVQHSGGKKAAAAAASRARRWGQCRNKAWARRHLVGKYKLATKYKNVFEGYFKSRSHKK